MKKVITYGTFDHLHQGHLNILKRAKELGDYLIVGVTSDNFDRERGKINVVQNTQERIAAVKSTGLVDEVIIEEYEGQKIDDIINYNIDVFTVGSDWKGKFDYLSDFCKVVYLDRTEGISSSEIRTKDRKIRLGLYGNIPLVAKVYNECSYVNGIEISGVSENDDLNIPYELVPRLTYDELIKQSDAIYIGAIFSERYELIKKALLNNKHVLCESPLAIDKNKIVELYEIAKERSLVLMEAIKTAYLTSYHRMLLLAKSGVIGKIVTIDSKCTSLEKRLYNVKNKEEKVEGSMFEWAPIAVLPILQLLGTDYFDISISSMVNENKTDLLSRINLYFKTGVASATVAIGAKSESDLVITGTKGYIYVPAPWWKSEYFEIRYEKMNNKKSYYFRSDGEGLRYELVCFVQNIFSSNNYYFIDKDISLTLANILNVFNDKQIYFISGK